LVQSLVLLNLEIIEISTLKLNKNTLILHAKLFIENNTYKKLKINIISSKIIGNMK
jgi:hypothetical protein